MKKVLLTLAAMSILAAPAVFAGDAAKKCDPACDKACCKKSGDKEKSCDKDKGCAEKKK